MVKKKKTKTLVLIDAHALVHRAFHALPPLNTGRGELVNAVFGFTSILLKVLKELEPDFLAATFDLPKPTFRHEEFEGYKAKRVKAPDELYAQIKRVKDVLAAFDIPIYEKEGFEADDVIGTIAKAAGKKNKVIIVTGDLDTLQLVDKNISVYTLKKGVKDTIMYDEAAVKERFGGLAPEQMNDYKGLKGDPSDNIPGVPGVGEKTAIELLKEFGSLEKLYKEIEKNKINQKSRQKLFEKLLANKEQAFFSKYLATIKLDVPLKFNLNEAAIRQYEKEKVVTLFKELGFYSLISRLSGDSGTRKKQGALLVAGKETLINSDEKIEQALAQGILNKPLYELEKKLAPILGQMEKRGILVDKDYLAKLGRQISDDLANLEKKIHQLAGGHFNISSPQQVSEILFNKLNIATKGLKKTPGKVISTAAGELQKLKGQHQIVDLVMEYRELAKLKTTYIDSLPRLTASDGRLHTSFDSLGTTTGRLSSKNPNLQNIPIRTQLGNEIRKAFVAAPGCQLLSADYSQIELRVVAHLAGDRNMIKAFLQGHDIHTATAAEVFEVPLEKVDAKMRRAAKVLNFGVIYGMSAHGFAQASGLEFGPAKDFIKKYFEEFSGVASYIEKTKATAAKTGFVETLFGRKRFIPEINSSAWNLRQAAERMAINMPVQGTAADLLKMAMVKIGERPELCDKLLLQVHDELVFEVPRGEIKKVGKEVSDIMEKVYQLAMPLKVDLEAGDNWGELKKI